MIFEGERNIEEKIKHIIDLNVNRYELNKMMSKRNVILYLCPECGLQITFEPKVTFSDTSRIDFDYDDFKLSLQDKPDYKPFENNYKNTNRGNWGGSASYFCLDCASGFSFEKENTAFFCEKCNSTNVVHGYELGGKPCPICGEKLNNGINIIGLEALFTKKRELSREWFNIYRERYQVKIPVPRILSKKEFIEQNRREELIKCFECDYYVIDNKNNVIRF